MQFDRTPPADSTPLADMAPLSSDLLRGIPLSARVVLDVGCGGGEMGAAFLSMNPTARVLGIEKDPRLAAIAAQRLSQVAVVDVEDDPLPFDVPGGIDCIVYSAVLEQLRDPWSVVRRHREALAPNGAMLFCVPNMEHWSFIDRLLRGAWDYEQSGLLDRTHLRWFTLESMRQGLVAAELSLCDVRQRVFDADRSQQFSAALAPGLAAIGIDPENFARRSMALQYVWRARKHPQERITISGNMLAPVGGVSHVRVVHPLEALATDPMVTVDMTGRYDTVPPPDDQPRIFILHRPALSGTHGRELLRSLMDSGWLVVTEYDDNPDFFQIMQGDAQLSFLGVHAVQTSTPALAQVLRRRNPEVAIFPNAIVSLPEVRNFAEPNSMTLFFGALNREQDWRALMPIINEVASQAGDRLKFQVVHDGAFFQALQTPHKSFMPLCDYETYWRLLGRCEISFMPLGDNGFNRAKSDLKFIEAAACRVAPLASSVVYGDSIEDGRTGLLFRDPEEFRDRLMRLVAMPELARNMGDAARRYVSENRMLADQVAPRLAWYRSLWARRELLTAGLRARIAAMPG